MIAPSSNGRTADSDSVNRARVYSGLNVKVLEQHRSTPTSVVKPQGL